MGRSQSCPGVVTLFRYPNVTAADNRQRMTDCGKFLPTVTSCRSKFVDNATIMERIQALLHMMKLA